MYTKSNRLGETVESIVRYEAADGTPVELSPEIVARDLLGVGNEISDRQMASFIATCRARRLNPLAGDCYLTVFKGKATVMVAKGYYMRVAAAQPTFDGASAGVVVIDREGKLTRREGALVGGQTERLVGGWAEVYDRGRSRPSRAEVSLAEYAQDNDMWEAKPATMIRKVALVQALREAYPNALDGTYAPEEMPAQDASDEPEYETEDTSAEN